MIKMSASTTAIAANRLLCRFICQQLLLRTAPTRCILPFRPSLLAAVPSVTGRFYSVDKDRLQNGDNTEHTSNSSEPWQDTENRNRQEEEEQEQEYEHSTRKRILDASLDYVLEHGWTKEAIQAAAQAEGLSQAVDGMFTRGGAEIVDHFYKKCNSQLVEHLKLEVDRLKADDQKLKIRPFIQNAVETRLKMIHPYSSIWKEAMAIQTLPQNATQSWKNLMNLSDDIWFYAGDRSTDFDWYTKRMSLAAIYKATEIYMLQDNSSDYEQTWLFLGNQLNDLDNLRSVTNKLGPLKEGIMGLVQMGRNVMGMNSRNR